VGASAVLNTEDIRLAEDTVHETAEHVRQGRVAMEVEVPDIHFHCVGDAEADQEEVQNCARPVAEEADLAEAMMERRGRPKGP
jgi:hypothetical protein